MGCLISFFKAILILYVCYWVILIAGMIHPIFGDNHDTYLIHKYDSLAFQ